MRSSWLLWLMVTLPVVTGSLFSRCTQHETLLNCSTTALTEIPSDLPDGVNVFDLTGNRITVISEVNIEGLKVLNMSDNTIKHIDDSVFSHMTELLILDLSKNRLTGEVLSKPVFEGLNSLTQLNLERNPIKRIKTNTFDFMYFLDLEYLDLSHCLIETIEDDAVHLTSLKQLDLSWNYLETLNEAAFRGMISLVTLDMSHNQIKVIENIPMMPDLQTWILDSNGIEKILIQEDLEYRADNLKELFLRNNEIKRFGPEDLPIEMQSINVLDMSDNKLECDCKMSWVAKREWEIKHKAVIMKCYSPPEVKGANLLQLKDEELICRTHVARILFIVVMSCTCVLMLIVVLFILNRWRKSRRNRRKAGWKGDYRGDFTAVYTHDDDDVIVATSYSKSLVSEKGKEFDV